MTCCVYSLATATQTFQQHKAPSVSRIGAERLGVGVALRRLQVLFCSGGLFGGVFPRVFDGCRGPKLTRVKGSRGEKSSIAELTPNKSRHSQLTTSLSRCSVRWRSFTTSARMYECVLTKTKTTIWKGGNTTVVVVVVVAAAVVVVVVVVCVFHPNVCDTAAPNPNIIHDTPNPTPELTSELSDSSEQQSDG